MSEEPLNIVKQYVDGAIKEVDDSEVRFKLRTASQFIDVAHHRKEYPGETTEGADSDD